MHQSRNVLIIDDDVRFPKMVAFYLRRAGYDITIANSVDSAIQHLAAGLTPTFVLADRMLSEGEEIERRELARLCASCPGVFVVIYTTVSTLTLEQEYQIREQGAIRVIDKKLEADALAEDIKLLTQEFDELIELSQELRTETQERSKIVSALVGTDVGLTIIDAHYHCWFANASQEYLIGGRACNGLCWRLFHKQEITAGPCWGCTVREVFQSHKVVDRLFLAKFTSDSTRWVSVRSTPIWRKTGDSVIAVREGVAEASKEYIASLGTTQRLNKIAQGLVHLGFGRVRIYNTNGTSTAVIAAAAAHTDNPSAAESSYMRKLQGITIDHRQCPYAKQAIKNHDGLVVMQWDLNLGPSPWADRLELELPYILTPVWDDAGKPCGLIGADFVGIPKTARKHLIDRLANNKTLSLLQHEYCREIKNAVRKGMGIGIQWETYKLLQDAKIGVGSCRTVSDAVAEIKMYLEQLLPKCSISTRRLLEVPDRKLTRYEPLCCGPTSSRIPTDIYLDDRKSLSAFSVRVKESWIDDYLTYQATAQAAALPVGYAYEWTKSVAHLLLRFENTVYGTVSVHSPEQIKWEESGARTMLLSIANLLALVMRDIALDEREEAAWRMAAAMVAHHVGNELPVAQRHFEIIMNNHGNDLGITQSCRVGLDAIAGAFRIIEDFKIYASASRIDPQVVPVAEVIDRLSERLKNIFPHVKIEKFCNLTDYSIQADVDKLGQVFVSFIVDSQRYTRENVPLKVTVGAELNHNEKNHFVVLVYTDNGRGISSALKEKIFDDFFTTSPTGSGVGLAFARKVASVHNGKICEIGEEGKGVHFEISLPAIITGEGND